MLCSSSSGTMLVENANNLQTAKSVTRQIAKAIDQITTNKHSLILKQNAVIINPK